MPVKKAGRVEGKSRRAPVAELFPPQGQWTEGDYFALPDRNRHIELSEGELIIPPHPSNRHQVAVLELAVRLRQFVVERGLGQVRIAPLPVRLWPGKIREPLRGRWGPGETASSELLRGFQVKVDDVVGTS